MLILQTPRKAGPVLSGGEHVGFDIETRPPDGVLSEMRRQLGVPKPFRY